MTHRKSAGFQQVGSLLREVHPDLIISKPRLRKVESIECVRPRREKARQNLGFSSRPFVLCSLPVRRPQDGSLLHERRNGRFILQVIGHPGYGLIAVGTGSPCSDLPGDSGDPAEVTTDRI